MQEKIDILQDSTITTQTNNAEPYLIVNQNNILCSFNNQASYICVSPKCQINGFICIQKNCTCKQKHLNCHQILLKSIFKKISNRKKINQSAKQSFLLLEQKINQMIQSLSILKQEFQFQQKYFNFTLQQTQFIKNIQQNNVEKVCGKIVSELEKSFEFSKEFQVMRKNKINFLFKSQKNKFEQLVKQIKDMYSKSLKIKTFILEKSNIIASKEDDRLLQKWIDQAFPQSKLIQTKLLFRASQHNFKAQSFHQKCDGKENTLLVLKNCYDKIIGGFTPCKLKFSSERVNVKDQSGKSFLFSLNLKEKYQCIKPQCAISYWSDNTGGPRFGSCQSESADLYIGNKANLNLQNQGLMSYGAFANAYNINNKYKTSKISHPQFTGSAQGKRWTVQQYQIYQIIAE